MSYRVIRRSLHGFDEVSLNVILNAHASEGYALAQMQPIGGLLYIVFKKEKHEAKTSSPETV